MVTVERRLIEANRELIQRLEKKIAAALASIWGEVSEPLGVGAATVEVE